MRLYHHLSQVIRVSTLLAIGCALPVCALAAATGTRHDTLRTGHGGHLYVVMKGDTLWSIAAKHFKNPWKWRNLHKLNKKSIKNPNRIYPGQVFSLGEPLPLEPIAKEPVTIKPVAITPTPAPSEPAPAAAPAAAPVISAQVISIYNGTSQAGQQTVVILDKGRRDGIENGQVLTLYQGDGARRGQSAASGTPEAGYGQAQVFRTFEKTSYATVTMEKMPVKVLDVAIKQ